MLGPVAAPTASLSHLGHFTMPLWVWMNRSPQERHCHSSRQLGCLQRGHWNGAGLSVGTAMANQVKRFGLGVN